MESGGDNKDSEMENEENDDDVEIPPIGSGSETVDTSCALSKRRLKSDVRGYFNILPLGPGKKQRFSFKDPLSTQSTFSLAIYLKKWHWTLGITINTLHRPSQTIGIIVKLRQQLMNSNFVCENKHAHIRENVMIEEAKPNNSVQMGCVNPFSTTMENPWLGINHQFLGRNNMMIQPQTNFVKVESGLSNNLQNGPNKRSREWGENQFNNLNMPPVTNNVPIQGFAPESNFPHDVEHFWDIDYILSQFNKNVNLEFETQQQRDAKLMMATLTSKFVKRLKTQKEQILRLSKLNMALQEKMKSLNAETQQWKDIAKTAETSNISLRKDFDNILSKVSKLNAPTNVVAVEEDAESCCGSTDSGKNNQEVDQDTARKSDSIDKKRIVCGGSAQFCPVCNCCMTTTIHACLT
ncbi:RING-type domain-containing protein [Heracleum sosnowskyi]|uniref:RING-type domain-containing protein n=1 Tax=Heracleum sosnowskyi TaxID=360622 RepID=A0AAD8MAC5_9APIA|nr:RING-type domain-containing protein [Heracleum sosnowskyi]